MNNVSIEKAYVNATLAYAMATALQNTVLNTKELRATYLKELHKQIQEIATFSEVVKTEFERVIHSLSE